MKAALVNFSFCTRVVVADDATEEEVIAAGIENMKDRLKSDMVGELKSNTAEVSPDEESPFDAAHDKPGKFGYFENIIA